MWTLYEFVMLTTITNITRQIFRISTVRYAVKAYDACADMGQL